ncbi:DUF2807 domain-containing protein [Halosquirtibacter xylanolyticus]|uniref:head GIN domain-containing protein n=1 Tax=Halosquirtibacter xylanolyticus TaxID=3374599 RepID=UPI003747A7D3|nr:DUF2807 domain-containing protein [Prolixibacteraceae bacterium]
MKKLLTMLSIILLSSCAKEYIEGEGPVIKDKELQIDPFTKISVEGPFTVNITQGTEQKVTITTEQNIIDRTNKVVVDGVWQIRLQEGDYKNILPKINVTVPNLTSFVSLNEAKVFVSEWDCGDDDLHLEASAGKLSFDPPVVAKNINITISKGAEIFTPKVSTNAIDVASDNCRDLSITGSTTKLNITHTGNGGINTRALQADDVTVVITNGSKVNVTANKTLNATVNGYGRIGYYGDPVITKSINGTGELNHYK